ncbi:MAG: radical SAM protein, partial [Rhodospirillales bacterium]
NRSLTPERIIEQAQALVEGGHREIVLTGADIASYGLDISASPGLGGLGGLVSRLLDEAPGVERLRLTSLDPGLDDDRLFALLADEPRLMGHLHLSVQSGDNAILKRMKRRHSRSSALEFVGRARKARPDVVLGADLIAGFPTETDKMFEATVSMIGEMALTYLHVFPFSPRPGTPAASMPQVPSAVINERAARLRQAGDRALAGYLQSRIGSDAEVLVEDDNRGHDRHYATVRLDFDAAPGDIVRARITGVEDSNLIGREIP